jgi:hypothetical protein
MAARPPAVRAAATVRPSAAMRSAHREMRCSAAVRAATTWAASDWAERPAAAMRSVHREMRRAAAMRAAVERRPTVAGGCAMESRCASERGLAMGGGRPAERRFMVGGSGKSVARRYRTVTPGFSVGSLAPGSAKVRRRLPPRAGACRGRQSGNPGSIEARSRGRIRI